MTTPAPESIEPEATDPEATDPEAPAPARPHWKRDVVVFLSGQTVSLFGSMLVQYAIMWHLTLTTKSGVVLALAAVFGFLPQAIVSIFGGVWADRVNRKMLIIIADATIAASTLVLALLMLSGVDALWLIFLTLAIRSTGAGIQMPAVSALIPQITPTEHLMRVNGVLGSIQSAMALIAPAVAGILYASLSIVSIFFVDVVTAVIGIGLIATLAIPTIVRAEKTGYFTDLVEGVRYVAHHAFVRWLLVLFGIVFLLAVAPSYLTPLMVARSFGDEVWKLTVLELSFSVGMVIGGVVIAVWGGTKNRVAMIVIASALFGVLSIAMGFTTNLIVFFVLMGVVGLAVPFFSTPSMTLLQETVEPERQGRVFGFLGIVMAVAMPIGMVAFGPLADVVSVESLLVIAGVIMFVVIAVAVLVPSGRRAIRAASAASGTAKDAEAPAAE
ncbi:MFS transporter [Leifsonia sp. H3M29-4]|uniref:MFS transporter n=1 Tax=Salinibacterium metalliresistens TaxID=3031321 RepID=UPI0023DA00ED|nr:MFS transporter [Salinibacterium metalliresistens]MDF1480020.1 MFS transporter [Salinibacterium metalliresistens]